jgi:acetyl-CoA C-acetyltransferase
VPLLKHEDPAWYKGFKYPGVHSFRAGRMAGKMAYEKAGIEDPREDIDFVELHDAYTSSEIQTYEDLGLCKYGDGGKFIDAGHPELTGMIPVNPSGGLLACGHPVGATGLMQAVFAFWQLQGSIARHNDGDASFQVQQKKGKGRRPMRGAIHSHAGTGTYVTVSILESTR